MSETEGFEILNSENAAAMGVKAEKPARLVARRNLVDISNLPDKHVPLNEDKKSQCIATTTKGYIEKLQKDNVTLSKMLFERNKLIELSGIELENLRLNLIEMQEQNRKLAVSHTQMLAELNSGKDKLKELHHVLGCQNGLLKARNIEFKEKAGKKPCKRADEVKSKMEDESLEEGRDEVKPRNAKRRVRSNSLCSSEPSQSEENATKRPSTRRRSSAMFETVESREDDDLFEVDDAKFSKCKKDSKPVLASVKDEAIIRESRGPRRSSLCRPSRMAANKVLSYKEIPLKIKMRRSE